MSLTRLRALVVIAAVVVGASSAFAVPADIESNFIATYTDARTDDNQYESGGKEYWSIDADADRYQNEYYERPTAQTFTETSTDVFGASQYYANLDITTARAGYDSQFMYVEINLVGNYFHKDDDTKDYEGLKYEYGFRFSSGTSVYALNRLPSNPAGIVDAITIREAGGIRA